MIGSYETSKTLGTGAFGTVVLAKKRNSDRQYAIKSISKKNILRSQMGSQVKKEIGIMKSLEHPNIVQIFEVLSSADYLYIVMDFVSGGELYTKITKSGRLSNASCRRYVKQLCSALNYCHSRNVCHRDIKPQNILLDKNDNVLLADFGFASIMEVDELGKNDVTFGNDDGETRTMELSRESNDKHRSMEGQSRMMKNMSTVCGTMSYMAPEIFNREKYTGDKADIWSLGIVIYVLLVGFMPFKEADEVKSKFSIPSFVSKDASDFVSNMLILEPRKRYSARRLLLHPWVINESESVNVKEYSSESDDNDDDSDDNNDPIGSDFTSEISNKSLRHDGIIETVGSRMKESDWNVRYIDKGIKASKMSLSGVVVVSIKVVGTILEVHNANISRDANSKVMGELSTLIKTVVK